MTEERTYSIGEIADEFDMTFRALRFYEERGLISPKRGQRGKRVDRVFSEADRLRVRNIKTVLDLGFMIEEARQIIQPDGSIKLPPERIRSQLEFLKNEAARILAARAALAAVLDEVGE